MYPTVRRQGRVDVVQESRDQGVGGSRRLVGFGTVDSVLLPAAGVARLAAGREPGGSFTLRIRPLGSGSSEKEFEPVMLAKHT